jgi:Mrp family chromosome partitioning ATPase
MPDDTTPSGGDSLREFARVLRRRWPLILACVIVVPVVAYAYTRTQTRQYSATASILLSDPSIAQGIAGTGSGSTPAANQATLLDTETGLASLSPVAQAAARVLGDGSVSLPGTVSINNDGTSNLLTVTATETGAGLAAQVANVYAREYMTFRARADVAQIEQEQDDIASQLRHRQSSSATAFLQQRQTQLATLASLQNGNMSLAAAATPPGAPSSPKTTRTVLAGGALGLVLGILMAVLFAATDRRLRGPDDVQAVLAGPILGAVPRSRQVAAANDGKTLQGPEFESFSMIYANMSNYHDRPIRSVLVTSAASGDGKSTVSWNLATAAALAGARVLLIEADMRNPTLAARLGATPKLGLSDLLTYDGELVDAVMHMTLVESVGSRVEGAEPEERWRVNRAHNGHRNGTNETNGHGNAKLHVLFAGKRLGVDSPGVPNPMAILASAGMRELIATTEGLFDLVVIDTPPTALVSDAIPLVKYVSGVIVVTRIRKNTRDTASQLRDQLDNLRARTLGVVVNGVDASDGYYGSASTSVSG